jgi:hypothetical protein
LDVFEGTVRLIVPFFDGELVSVVFLQVLTDLGLDEGWENFNVSIEIDSIDCSCERELLSTRIKYVVGCFANRGSCKCSLCPSFRRVKDLGYLCDSVFVLHDILLVKELMTPNEFGSWDCVVKVFACEVLSGR